MSRPAKPGRVPAAFPLTLEGKAETVALHDGPDPFAHDAPPVDAAVEAAPSRLFSLSTVFWGALSLLATLALALWGADLFDRLTLRAPWLGQLALGVMAVLVALVILFVVREALGFLRLSRVSGLRAAVRAALASNDRDAASAVVRDLAAFYARDPASTAARAEITAALKDIHDGVTLIAIAERGLLRERDAAARRAIAAAAQRVSIVTALSPRALVDLLFVLAQAFALIRKLGAIYGGRASGFGLLRLAARVMTHLAVTGGMAMTDSILGQVVGAGFAARLSAKLGEGVLNGILTARVGIAALDLCRPMDFGVNTPILLSEVVSIIVTRDKIAENPAA